MRKFFGIVILLIALSAIALFPREKTNPPIAEFHILFDRSKGEARSGQPWAIDDDDPLPLPEHPLGEGKWSGSLSDLAHRLYLTSRYSFETLPPGGSITWQKRDNSQDLSLFDLLVFCEPQVPFHSGEISALRSFLNAGGSILLIGGSDAGADRKGGMLDSLNGLLDPLFGHGRGIRFGKGLPVGSELITISDPGPDAIVSGPFGQISRLWARNPLRIETLQSEGAALIGPKGSKRGPLYGILPSGEGKIALLSDPYLLAGGEGMESADNLTLSMNLIAYLVGDRHETGKDSPVTITEPPAFRFLTDTGVTLSFRTDRPTWAVVEVSGRKDRVIAFRELAESHDLRIDGLKPESDYRLSISLYDGWGNGPFNGSFHPVRTLQHQEIAHGDIVISEVFWGGEDQYIELFNTLDATVDLRGWTIMDEEARYHLKGFVEGGSYYLLSRQGHEVTLENGETYGHEAESLYLDPAGELIILQDENGDVISTANLTGEAWPAGKTGTEPASMERVFPGGPDEADNWDTALLSGAGFQGTPGLPNSRRGVLVFDPGFNGGVVEGGIRLTWEVFPGDSVVGVNIYRSEVLDGEMDDQPSEYIRMNRVLIPSDRGEYLDGGVGYGTTYQYILGAIYPGGNEMFSEPVRIRSSVAGLPKSFIVEMGQNFPNPFNPQTEIRFSIEAAEGGEVPFPLMATLSIFNVRGQQVRKVMESEVGPGDFAARWDGKDDSGEPVSSGSYYYRLTLTKPGTQEVVLQMSKKMVLLR